MITKTVEPIMDSYAMVRGTVVGTKVEYRVFGILLYKKILHTPFMHGINFLGEFFTRF